MSYIQNQKIDTEKEMEYFIMAIRAVVREEVAIGLADFFGSKDGDDVKKTAGYRPGAPHESFV